MRHSFLRNSIVIFLILLLTLLFSSIESMAQVKLAWDPNTEPDLAGYQVYYGTASGNYGYSIDVGNVATYTLMGLTQGVTYYIAVTAYDSADNESAYSNEVSYTTPVACTYSISPTSQVAGSSGGAALVNVTTSPGCAWTVASNASWIILTSNSSMTGSGTVNYSVSANSGTTSRTGTMSIAGKTFTVTQSGSSSGSWVFCADEGQVCSFTGTRSVRYGANGAYVFKTLTNGTTCTNSVFGDPIYGVKKQCYIQ
jgi:hypothetical protein